MGQWKQLADSWGLRRDVARPSFGHRWSPCSEVITDTGSRHQVTEVTAASKAVGPKGEQALCRPVSQWPAPEKDE